MPQCNNRIHARGAAGGRDGGNADGGQSQRQRHERPCEGPEYLEKSAEDPKGPVLQAHEDERRRKLGIDLVDFGAYGL